MEAFAPGLWASVEAELSRVVEPMEELEQGAKEAAPAARNLNLELARIGVQAAQVQAQADRVRRGFDGQLEPLERQLRLLQQSADLQRVQNALASNRGAVERLRLEREIVALQRAAGGAEDPAAEGLTLRQRLIALALQEKRLRQEELGLEEERRPLVQSLQERIEAIQEEQRQALEPLQDQLDAHRKKADALQLERQEAEALKLELEAAAAAAQDRAGAKPRRRPWPTPGSGARPSPTPGSRAGRTGSTRTGATSGGPHHQLQPLVRGRRQGVAGQGGHQIGETVAGAAAAAFGSHRADLFPAGAPRVEGRFDPAASLPSSPSGPPPGRPGAAGDANITINLADIAHAPGFQQRLQAAFEQFWAQFMQAEAATDPGASGPCRAQGVPDAPRHLRRRHLRPPPGGPAGHPRRHDHRAGGARRGDRLRRPGRAPAAPAQRDHQGGHRGQLPHPRRPPGTTGASGSLDHPAEGAARRGPALRHPHLAQGHRPQLCRTEWVYR